MEKIIEEFHNQIINRTLLENKIKLKNLNDNINVYNCQIDELYNNKNLYIKKRVDLKKVKILSDTINKIKTEIASIEENDIKNLVPVLIDYEILYKKYKYQYSRLNGNFSLHSETYFDKKLKTHMCNSKIFTIYEKIHCEFSKMCNEKNKFAKNSINMYGKFIEDGDSCGDQYNDDYPKFYYCSETIDFDIF